MPPKLVPKASKVASGNNEQTPSHGRMPQAATSSSGNKAETSASGNKAATPASGKKDSFAALVSSFNDALDDYAAAPGLRKAANEFTANVFDLFVKEIKTVNNPSPKPTAPSTAPSSYAAAARAPAPEPHLSPREQRELRVRCPEGSRINKDLAIREVNKRIDAVTAGRFLAARQLPSGDVIFIADTAETKAIAEACKGSWEHILGANAAVAPKRHTVIVHGVKTSLFPNDTQDENLLSLTTQNPNVTNRGNFVKTTWRKRVFRQKKRYSSLLVDVSTPELANHMIDTGLVVADELHEVELFDSRCLLTRCYKCQGYSHTAAHCNKTAVCSICSDTTHHHTGCPRGPIEHRCVNCKGNHAAGSQSCPVHQRELRRVEEARMQRPRLFPVPPGGTVSPIVLPTTGKRTAAAPPETPTRGRSAPAQRSTDYKIGDTSDDELLSDAIHDA